MTTINEAIATSKMTCGSFPEQYEGQLKDGRHFYFRYRYGVASLGIAATLDDAVADSFHNEIRVRNDLTGEFESPEERDRVFAELLKNRPCPDCSGPAGVCCCPDDTSDQSPQ